MHRFQVKNKIPLLEDQRAVMVGYIYYERNWEVVGLMDQDKIFWKD